MLEFQTLSVQSEKLEGHIQRLSVVWLSKTVPNTVPIILEPHGLLTRINHNINDLKLASL